MMSVSPWCLFISGCHRLCVEWMVHSRLRIRMYSWRLVNGSMFVAYVIRVLCVSCFSTILCQFFSLWYFLKKGILLVSTSTHLWSKLINFIIIIFSLGFRIKFYTQEIVFFRQDLLYRMRRSCLIPPSKEETADPFEHVRWISFWALFSTY